MGKKSTPDAPDYRGAAEEQGQQSRMLTHEQTLANRPDIYTPFGYSKWQQDPETGQWENFVGLDPAEDDALNYQQGVARDLSRTGSDLTGRAHSMLMDPLDYEGFREYGDIGDYDERRNRAETAAYDRSTSRLDPYWEQKVGDMDIKLRNQGLVPGDEAYDRAMGNTLRARTDAYSVAEADAVASGRAESDLAYRQQMGEAELDSSTRQAQIAEELQRRGWTVNEINSLISGREVGMPGIPDFKSAGRATTPDYMGAAGATYGAELDAYNARQARLQGLFSGLSSLARGGYTMAKGYSF